LAKASLAAGDEETAIEAATHVLEKQSDDREMLKLRAEAQLRQNRFDNALADVESLEKLDPDDEVGPVMRLQCLIGLGRLDEAETLFAKLETESSAHELPEAADERFCAARAVFAKEKDDPKLAEQRFEGCLKSFPSSRLVVRAAASFFDETGHKDRASEILRALLLQDPSASDVRELLAMRLRDAGQAKEAEALLLEGTKLEPAVALEAWGGLASHYFQLGDYAASVSAWEEALKRFDNPGPEYLFGYSEALLRAGRYDKALEVAGKLPEANAEIIRGMVSFEQKQPADALKHFEAGLRLWPNHSVARRYAAVAAERAGDFDRAIAEYRQSLRSGPGDTDAGLRLAQLYDAEGAYESAFQAISMYRDAHPGDIETELTALRISVERERGKVRIGKIGLPPESRVGFAARAAEIIARDGFHDDAIRFLDKTAELDFMAPENAAALRELVLQLFAAGKAGEARARVEKALAAHPDAASLVAVHALVLERGGAPAADARKEYARAIELDPNCASALAALGRLDAAAGNAESARSFYGRAAAADPDDVDSRRRAAELAASAGDLDDAQRRLEALLEDRPYDAATAADLARLLIRRGADLERARSLARQAVRFGGGQEAYALVIETHLDAGQAQRAVAALNAAADRSPDDASLRYQLGRALAAAGQRDAAREAFQRALAGGDFPERNDATTALAALSAKAEGG
ncbi:MAG TPA: tetratricopeptide repeat protein, partial [Myxococcota bacterium]|nr:tetratricopeptide repeat protein [Myxococcota bacterium]